MKSMCAPEVLLQAPELQHCLVLDTAIPRHKEDISGSERSRNFLQSLISVFLPSPAEHSISRTSQHLAGSTGSLSVNPGVSLSALGWGS